MQILIRRGSDPPAVDLFLERAAPGAALPPYNPGADLLLFVKAFRGSAVPQPIKYMGHAVLQSMLPLRVSTRWAPDHPQRACCSSHWHPLRLARPLFLDGALTTLHLHGPLACRRSCPSCGAWRAWRAGARWRFVKRCSTCPPEWTS